MSGGEPRVSRVIFQSGQIQIIEDSKKPGQERKIDKADKISFDGGKTFQPVTRERINKFLAQKGVEKGALRYFLHKGLDPKDLSGPNLELAKMQGKLQRVHIVSDAELALKRAELPETKYDEANSLCRNVIAAHAEYADWSPNPISDKLLKRAYELQVSASLRLANNYFISQRRTKGDLQISHAEGIIAEAEKRFGKEFADELREIIQIRFPQRIATKT